MPDLLSLEEVELKVISCKHPATSNPVQFFNSFSHFGWTVVFLKKHMYVLLVAKPPPLFLNFLKDFYVEGAELFFIFNKGQKWTGAKQARFKFYSIKC